MVTSSLIFAGTLANSGLEAKVVRLSTASINGLVALAQLALFSSEKLPSNACNRITPYTPSSNRNDNIHHI